MSRQNTQILRDQKNEEILYESVTKTYKKANPSLLQKVNIEAKIIDKEFRLGEKLKVMAKQR